MSNGAGAFWLAQQAARNPPPLCRWLIVFSPETRTSPMWVETKEAAYRVPSVAPKAGLLEYTEEGRYVWHDWERP